MNGRVFSGAVAGWNAEEDRQKRHELINQQVKASQQQQELNALKLNQLETESQGRQKARDKLMVDTRKSLMMDNVSKALFDGATTGDYGLMNNTLKSFPELQKLGITSVHKPNYMEDSVANAAKRKLMTEYGVQNPTGDEVKAFLERPEIVADQENKLHDIKRTMIPLTGSFNYYTEAQRKELQAQQAGYRISPTATPSQPDVPDDIQKLEYALSLPEGKERDTALQAFFPTKTKDGTSLFERLEAKRVDGSITPSEGKMLDKLKTVKAPTRNADEKKLDYLLNTWRPAFEAEVGMDYDPTTADKATIDKAQQLATEYRIRTNKDLTGEERKSFSSLVNAAKTLGKLVDDNGSFSNLSRVSGLVDNVFTDINRYVDIDKVDSAAKGQFNSIKALLARGMYGSQYTSGERRTINSMYGTLWNTDKTAAEGLLSMAENLKTQLDSWRNSSKMGPELMTIEMGQGYNNLVDSIEMMRNTVDQVGKPAIVPDIATMRDIYIKATESNPKLKPIGEVSDGELQIIMDNYNAKIKQAY